MYVSNIACKVCLMLGGQCVRFHPNSLYVATGSSDHSCRLWDVHRGNTVRVFLGHQNAVTTMAMSTDGKYMASAGMRYISLEVQPTESKFCIRCRPGHQALGSGIWQLREDYDGSYRTYSFFGFQR